jgi:hypothetical protein
MAKSVRVNLSLPPEMAEVVADVAKQSGRSAAGVVMEAIAYRLPYWREWLAQAKSDGLFRPSVPFPKATDEVHGYAEPETKPLTAAEQKLSPAERLMRKAQEHRQRSQAAIKRERAKASHGASDGG